MTVTLTSRQFNHDTGRAKKAAESEPVIITHRGRPSHVLLSVEEYERLMGHHRTIVELLAMPGVEEIEFEAPRIDGPAARPVDFS